MREWPWYGYLLLAVIILGLFYFLYFKPHNEELNLVKEERLRTEAEIVQLRAKKEENMLREVKRKFWAYEKIKKYGKIHC